MIARSARTAAVACALAAWGAAASSARSEMPPEALPQGGASPGSAASIPTDKPKLRAFCADRPAQATLPCTLDKGHVQLETDLFNASYDRGGGMVTDTYLFTSPRLKLGIADRTDVELAISPYEQVRIHDPSSGRTDNLHGPGDLTFGLKQNFFGDYRGPLALAVEPFVTAPTGRRGIGDGGWEGGLLAPVAFGFKAFVLNLTPEIDLRRNAMGGGVHPEPVEIVNVAWSLPSNVNLSTELYARQVQDPSGVVTKVSADLALALGLPNDLQLDVGVNLGLNPRTPAAQGYTGLSKRF